MADKYLWCIMGDEVQLGSLAHNGEWEHEVPEQQLP